MRFLTEREIIVASHNEGKVKEINHLVQPFGLIARPAKDFGLDEPAEDGATFEENAYIKAFAAASTTGLPALSDDSGLCVDALGGAPGIYTADWAEKPDGSGRDFKMAMQKLEDALVQAGAANESQRRGRFVAVLCLCWPDGHGEYFRGEVEGTIVWPPRGNKGFGYDPVFQPEDHDITFGEMEANEKHGPQNGPDEPGLSHRARAFAKFVATCLEPGLKPGLQTV